MESILYSTLVLGGLGLAFGLLLAFAAKKFFVYVDPRIEEVRSRLPGVNCGACSFEGCDVYAENVVAGKAPINRCPVGGAEVVEALARIMGTDATPGARMVASVRCRSVCSPETDAYIYHGVFDCRKAAVLPGGGPRNCAYGCLGFEHCVRECDFGAISMRNGIAAIDRDLCVGCGKCVAECPRGVIELIPASQPVRLACNNPEKGGHLREICSVCCIGCGLCAKLCPEKAIDMERNLPVIDPALCTGCGTCAERCPMKSILFTRSASVPQLQAEKEQPAALETRV